MKTIEEKARAYDRAKDIMEKYLKSGNAGVIAENTIKNAFPELHENEDEIVKEELINYLKHRCNTTTLSGEERACNKWIDWLEKQGEQKPADYEPKFHEGEWVVINGLVLKIQEVHNDLYDTTLQNGELRIYDTYILDNDAHLWTIQDAKDGDVLATDSWLYIFKFTNNEALIQFHCTCPMNGRPYKWCFSSDSDDSYLDIYVDANIHPATKEQRDILFQKMKEVGYEWNPQKKELKKIEHKPMLSDFFNAEYERGKADALKCVEWSEEDERAFHHVLSVLEEYGEEYPSKSKFVCNWLKSIKVRIEGDKV